jgi:hypothetical protein
VFSEVLADGVFRLNPDDSVDGGLQRHRQLP